MDKAARIALYERASERIESRENSCMCDAISDAHDDLFGLRLDYVGIARLLPEFGVLAPARDELDPDERAWPHPFFFGNLYNFKLKEYRRARLTYLALCITLAEDSDG